MHNTRLVLRQSALVALAICASTSTALAQLCTSDAECAEPLVCRPGSKVCQQSGSMSADGGMTVSEPVCEASPAACTLVLTACLTSSECTQPGWTCLPLTDAVPATNICFPKGIDCSAGASCPAGWSCLDFATVKEADMAAMWTATGSTQFCWPDALRGVPNGTTKVDATKAGVTGVKGGGTESPTSGLGPASDDGSPSVLAASDGGTAPGSNKASGCAMVGGSGSLWLPLALVLAWRLGRRRRR